MYMCISCFIQYKKQNLTVFLSGLQVSQHHSVDVLCVLFCSTIHKLGGGSFGLLSEATHSIETGGILGNIHGAPCNIHLGRISYD